MVPYIAKRCLRPRYKWYDNTNKGDIYVIDDWTEEGYVIAWDTSLNKIRITNKVLIKRILHPSEKQMRDFITFLMTHDVPRLAHDVLSSFISK